MSKLKEIIKTKLSQLFPTVKRPKADRNDARSQIACIEAERDALVAKLSRRDPERTIFVTAPADPDSRPMQGHISRISGVVQALLDAVEFADAGDRSIFTWESMTSFMQQPGGRPKRSITSHYMIGNDAYSAFDIRIKC